MNYFLHHDRGSIKLTTDPHTQLLFNLPMMFLIEFTHTAMTHSLLIRSIDPALQRISPPLTSHPLDLSVHHTYIMDEIYPLTAVDRKEEENICYSKSFERLFKIIHPASAPPISALISSQIDSLPDYSNGLFPRCWPSLKRNIHSIFRVTEREYYSQLADANPQCQCTVPDETEAQVLVSSLNAITIHSRQYSHSWNPQTTSHLFVNVRVVLAETATAQLARAIEIPTNTQLKVSQYASNSTCTTIESTC
jgi:hypothetical protein